MNPKSRVSHKPRIVSKVAEQIRARRVSLSNLIAPARKTPERPVKHQSPIQARQRSVEARQSLEHVQAKAEKYTKAVKPSTVLQAKRNMYRNLKKKDIRAYKRQKARQLVAIFLDYQVFRLEHSNNQVAKFVLAMYNKKLELVDFVHQLTCDIRELTTAVY